MTHTERLREVVERHYGRIAPAALEAAHILLCESRELREALLGEAFREPQSAPPLLLAISFARASGAPSRIHSRGIGAGSNSMSAELATTAF